MHYRNILLPAILLITYTAAAQQKWDLKQCVEYALANNISIKQSEVQEQLAGLQVRQNKLSQYPTLNFSGGTSYSSGRNQDPTTFSLITEGFVSANMQLQSSAQIFNFFSRRNTILASEWQLMANKAGTEKLRNDIALAVANAYLQALLAGEQEKIAAVQLEQSKVQLDNTRKLVNAGSLPELNAAELEAQVARDSASYVTAKGNTIQAILSLKAFMTVDAAEPFEIAAPPVELIPIEKIGALQPEAVYALALANLPQQRVNDYNLKAAQYNASAARAAMLPTLSGFGSLSSAFNSRAMEINGSSQVNAPLGKVNVSGTEYDVFPLQPFTVYNYSKPGFFDQMNQYFRQAIGVSISVPIFNGGNARMGWERSKLSMKNIELQKTADNLQLKQDIYQAYNAAMVALERFNASKKIVETSQRTYDFAQKRYSVGMLTTLELITNQNNLFRAKLEYVLNQFDYVFKMKVLEFYKGQGLKL
ncbi:MAG TPA: TolC family protein [Ferruginibacter sp.]|nr:TolC family protein [Ferruginibacter sp.]